MPHVTDRVAVAERPVDDAFGARKVFPSHLMVVVRCLILEIRGNRGAKKCRYLQGVARRYIMLTQDHADYLSARIAFEDRVAADAGPLEARRIHAELAMHYRSKLALLRAQPPRRGAKG